jgi:hypothetical protein
MIISSIEMIYNMDTLKYSYSDALSNIEEIEYESLYGFYVYVDENLGSEMELAWNRIEGTDTIIGKWKFVFYYNEIKTTTQREYFEDFSLTDLTEAQYSEEKYGEVDNTVYGSFSLSTDNTITINRVVDEEEVSQARKHYLVNDYNTLIFDPCSHVE